MSAKPIKILGIPGSLRELSFNRALIQAASDVAPEGVDVEMFLLHDVPFYNADVEVQGNPEPVQRLKDAIGASDGVLFATPQYNASVSGVLKNAVDWASRPAFESVLLEKPVAIIGATTGRSATEKARTELMNVLRSTRSHVMESPTIGISNSRDHIEAGDLHSEEVRDQIRDLLADFALFIRGHSLSEAAD
ncbi:MAG: NADPH-dependent FMN reductase [Thermomicrobiales bacterium]